MGFRFKHIIPLVLFLFSTKIASGIESKDKNILILHSYHQGLEWTDYISRGIMEVFRERVEYNLTFQNMDTKRYYNDSLFKTYSHLFFLKNDISKFDGIIASDNAACQFISKYYEAHFSKIPIVLCGINNPDTTHFTNKTNITVIKEEADHIGTIRAMKSIFPQRDHIIIFNDNTITGKAISQELKKVIPQFEPDLKFSYISEFCIDEFNSKLNNLTDRDQIYVLVVNQDKNGEFISYARGIKYIKDASPVPIFGSWDFYLGKGIVGGKITSGDDHGAKAANTLLKILEGKYNGPRFISLKNKYIFDKKILDQFNVPHHRLPRHSQIINSKDKTIVRLLWIGISVSILITSLLLLRLWVKDKNEKKLAEIIQLKTKELQSAHDKKDQFFAVLAHDLRSSLGTLRNLNRLLYDKHESMPTDRVKKLQKQAAILTNSTYTFLEDLLYWGKLQFKKSKPLQLSVLNIHDLVNRIAHYYLINENNNTLQIDVNKDASIETEEFIISFIIRNFIDNAIKYSTPNSTISISYEIKEGYHVFSIGNEGQGLSNEEIEKIYNKMPNSKKGGKGQSSFGFGLNSTLEYLNILNGELKIESVKGEFANFKIMLPV